jgi:hypothetical protein
MTTIAAAASAPTAIPAPGPPTKKPATIEAAIAATISGSFQAARIVVESVPSTSYRPFPLPGTIRQLPAQGAEASTSQSWNCSL